MYPTRVKTIPALSEERAEKIWSMYGADRQKRQEAVQMLQEWLQTQPHLPKNIEDPRLDIMFFRCKNSIQKAKDAIDMYYTLRTALPEFFSNRDPKSDWFDRLTSMGAAVPMPILTSNNERVVIFKGLVPDLSEFDLVEAFRVSFMIFDIRTVCDISAGDIWVLDLTNHTPQVLLKFTPPLMKKIEVLCLKGFKGRFCGLHLINAPPYVNAFVSLIKSVLRKQKLKERIHVHPKGQNNLHAFMDKHCLPQEYGGDAGPIQQYWDAWKETLVECREWFLEQENVKADESKRPQKSVTYDDLFGFEGAWKETLMECREWFLEQENVKVDESKRPQKSITCDDLFGFEGSFRQLSLD